MKKVQDLKDSDLKSEFKKIMASPTLDAIPPHMLTNIRYCFINQKLQKTFFQLISKKIKEKDVVVRIKCWILLHMLLTGRVTSESAEII